ncbi:DUF6902 family protein [Marimonas lutisalis]|uniref:DUF6902 family protein n=1 Tax=Marimonas lutisalis TaxID=2545756 RepID=UPI0010F72E45|nr:hypothetical protein [Marimonas lutisalis]
MSKVVQFKAPSQNQTDQERQRALLECFARNRRFGDDVFWLKENAELLNILECTGAKVSRDTLAAHQGFYDGLEKQLLFFPQYYRFLLSICLDLEDLGIGGKKGEKLVQWVLENGMIDGELSDLQRAEAKRLMLRRGRDPMKGDDSLEDRIRTFTARTHTFALPNKKAAYELTHAVFYLSEYGRKIPDLDPAVEVSLDFTGTLAFLDQNADLLAEVCVAMRYAGFAPPEIWEVWLARHSSMYDIQSGAAVSVLDDYHEFFVCNWFLATTGQPMFRRNFNPERMAFFAPKVPQAPLRGMSESMLHLDSARSTDWQAMRGKILDNLSEEAQGILWQAESASMDFEAFFAGFSRASHLAAAS